MHAPGCEVFSCVGRVPADVLPGEDHVAEPGFDPHVVYAAGAGLLRGVQHTPPHTVLSALQLPGRRPHLCSGNKPYLVITTWETTPPLSR